MGGLGGVMTGPLREGADAGGAPVDMVGLDGVPRHSAGASAGAPSKREGFTVFQGGGAPNPRLGPGSFSQTPQLAVGGDYTDEAWDEGRGYRTPESALAEYYGDAHVASDTILGGAVQEGVAYGSTYAWGTDWKDNGGTRAFRYETVPFWQKTGTRDGYDHDIEETLGTQMRETGNPVRGWDMDRLRQPRGQEYRRLGPRSGPIV